MRSEILSDSFCRELAKLRTEVAPMPRETVLEALRSEYDTPLEEIFDASLYMGALTSNKANHYLQDNGLKEMPVPSIELDDSDPAALSVMSVEPPATGVRLPDEAFMVAVAVVPEDQL